MKKSILLLFLALFHLFSYSQILDTSGAHKFKPIHVYTVQAADIDLFTMDSTSVDTTLNLFYNYYPAYKSSFPFVDLGQEASPMLSLRATHQQPTKVDLGINAYRPLFFDHQVHIYHTPKPFTRLNYAQGSNEMLNIEVTHAQQISKRLSFGLDYRRIKNQNSYFSNIQNITNARVNNLFNNKFYIGYYSNNRKYEAVFSYLWNKSTNIESGGIVSDSIFETQSGREKLNNNEAHFIGAHGYHAQNAFKLTQYLRPGGKSTDSTTNRTLEQFNNQFVITTELKNERIEFIDNQPDSMNYGFRTVAFRDSFYHQQFSNEVAYAFKLKPLKLYAGINYIYDRIYMENTDTVFQNVYARAKGDVAVKKIILDAQASIGLIGYNLGDYLLKTNLNTDLKGFVIKGTFLSQLAEPSFSQKIYQAIAQSWNNNFKKISVNQLSGAASYTKKNHKLKANIIAESTLGMVYFTPNIGAVQYNDLVTLLQTGATYAYTTTMFGTEATLLFQNSSNQQVLPRPSTSATGNIYTRFHLFKKNLGVQVGARAFRYSAFNSPVYNPVIKQWENTNTTFEMTPPINLYVNGKVKSFCFGIEFFHTQQGFMGTNYYASPGYPLLQRSMRLNLQWDLNN